MSNPLEQLPVRVFKARVVGEDRWVDVLVDGDYDGEYFASLKWRVLKDSNHVVRNYDADYTTDRTGQTHKIRRKSLYLSSLVLPPKEGFYVKHINGNNLDNRSCNLMYYTGSERAQEREARGPQRRKEYCIRGHALTGDNIYVIPKTGGRQCRECMRIRHRERVHKKRMALYKGATMANPISFSGRARGGRHGHDQLKSSSVFPGEKQYGKPTPLVDQEKQPKSGAVRITTPADPAKLKAYQESRAGWSRNRNFNNMYVRKQDDESKKGL